MGSAPLPAGGVVVQVRFYWCVKHVPGLWLLLSYDRDEDAFRCSSLLFILGGWGRVCSTFLVADF